MAVNIIRRALLDAAGTCVAEGDFPLLPVPSFSVDEISGGFETDFAVVTEEVFGINRNSIAKSICKHISHCSEIEISDTCIENGIIRIYIKNTATN